MFIELTNKLTGKKITMPRQHAYLTDNVDNTTSVGIAGTEIYFDIVETYEEAKAVLTGESNGN